MRHRRSNERGFALLLVFALAAAVAVMLYLEMPRVAFEHQRTKEDLLADRGEQYVRAIQLYVKKFNKYPQTLDDLETTNNMRFLRRRYKDPLTGSDEWRLIHVDNMGQYTDSLVYKKKDEQKKDETPNLLASQVQGIGDTATVAGQTGQSNSPALQKRASDRLIPTGGSAPASTPGTEGDTDRSGPPDPNSAAQPQYPPGQAPVNPDPQAVAAPPAPGAPTQLPQGMNPIRTATPGQGGTMQPGVNPQQGSGQQGSGSSFGLGSGSGFGFGSGSGSGTGSTSGGTTPTPGQSRSGGGVGTSGGMGSGVGGGSFGGSMPSSPGVRNPAGAPNSALTDIRNQMSGTRTAGGQTLGGQANTSATGGAMIQGGIAGVASKRELDSIRLYNEKSNYKEWEFLYDRKKELESQGMAGGGAMGAGVKQGQDQAQGSQSGSSSFFSGSGSSGSSSSGSSSGSSFGFGSGGSSSDPRPAPAQPSTSPGRQ